jgi:hypothetical protein
MWTNRWVVWGYHKMIWNAREAREARRFNAGFLLPSIIMV